MTTQQPSQPFVLPNDTQLVHIQFNGNGKFEPCHLTLLDDGVLQILATKALESEKAAKKAAKRGGASRHADALGCRVSLPKKSRKGHPHSFRLDLSTADSSGDTKYIVSVHEVDALERWMGHLQQCAETTRPHYMAYQEAKRAPVVGLKQVAAAVQVQRIARGQAGRRQAGERRRAQAKAKRQVDLETAAVRIQAITRGWVTRKRISTTSQKKPEVWLRTEPKPEPQPEPDPEPQPEPEPKPQQERQRDSIASELDEQPQAAKQPPQRHPQQTADVDSSDDRPDEDDDEEEFSDSEWDDARAGDALGKSRDSYARRRLAREADQVGHQRTTVPSDGCGTDDDSSSDDARSPSTVGSSGSEDNLSETQCDVGLTAGAAARDLRAFGDVDIISEANAEVEGEMQAESEQVIAPEPEPQHWEQSTHPQWHASPPIGRGIDDDSQSVDARASRKFSSDTEDSLTAKQRLTMVESVLGTDPHQQHLSQHNTVQRHQKVKTVPAAELEPTIARSLNIFKQRASYVRGRGFDTTNSSSIDLTPGSSICSDNTVNAVHRWLCILHQQGRISKQARDQFANVGTDEDALLKIRRKLSVCGSRAQRNLAAQLDELEKCYGLRTLGERLRFVSALEELAASGLTIGEWVAQQELGRRG